MLKLLPSLSLEQYKKQKVSWLNWLFRKRAIDLILLTPPGPSGSTWDHMGPHGTTHGTTATEESGVPCPATGNLGSIPQKIETYWGNLGAQIPTLVGFFEVLFS